LCFNGAEEAIFCALNSICKPNKNVIVVTPCYQSFIEIPRNNGCSVTQIQLLEEDKWDLRIPAIEEVIRPNTEAIIINCPNNITGLAFDSKKMSALVDLCKKYNLWLFNDETNKYFQKTDYNPTNSVCEMYEKGIVVSSLSKPFGLSGLRFGWVASKNKQILEQFLKFKHYLSACNSGPCEIIALIALNNKDYLIERNNQIISQNINILDKFMKDYDKLFFWIKPNCGCVGLVRYKNLNESVDILAKRLVKNVGILILPASVLHFNKQYFRIGFGKSDFPEAIKKLYIFFEKRK
jgi:aspartate/methionine/tyrosine aminotransferase